MKYKYKVKIGDKVDFVDTKRKGREITFEKKQGKALQLRTVQQVLVYKRGNVHWVDLDILDEVQPPIQATS